MTIVSFFIIIAIVISIVQYIYWVIMTSRMQVMASEVHISGTSESSVFCSVIICAHNEAGNLTQYLPYFLNQDYPLFEVIVVDDRSTDATWAILHEFKKEYEHLKVLQIPDDVSGGKKRALTLGIQHAKGTVILLSDADCYPVSERWIYGMINGLNESCGISVGYSPFENKNSCINTLARYENVITAFQYMGLGSAGMPYMAVGRNWAFHKHLIERVGFYTSHDHIKAGDDDLTFQQISPLTQVRYTCDPSTWVMSLSEKTAASYWSQKKRHFGVSVYYKPFFVTILTGFALSWLLSYISLAMLAIMSVQWLFLVILLQRIVLIFSVKNTAEIVFGQYFTWWKWIMLDVIFPFIWLIMAIFGAFYGRKSWT